MHEVLLARRSASRRLSVQRVSCLMSVACVARHVSVQRVSCLLHVSRGKSLARQS